LTHRPARLVGTVAGAVVGFGTALLVLWGPAIRTAASGDSLSLCIKDYYAPDQYSVLAIARNVRDGRSPYTEPFSATGDSVYPSEYYRLLGQTARAADTTVLWSWNIVGIVVSCALVAVSVWWARRLAPGTRAWLLAPAPFLIGTLYWWVSGGEWLFQSGFAVLWPPVASVYSPGAEGPALVLAGISLIAFVAALSGRGRSTIAWAALAGAPMGLSLQVHANVAVFCVVATVLTLLWDFSLAGPGRRRAAMGGVAGGLLLLGVVAPDSGVLVRLGVLFAVAAVALAGDREWVRRRWRVVAVWAATAAVASLPLSVRLASEVLSGGSYFYERQEGVSAVNTNLPIIAIALLWLPLWLLVAGVVRRLAQRSDAAAHPGWLALVAALASATLMLALGGRLGAQGLEWHRFLIVGTFFTTMAAAPALWLMLRDAGNRREFGIGLGLGVCLAATLPTTLAFAYDQRSAMTCTIRQEADAYRAIGEAAGRDRVILLDRCFVPGPFKVFSGARVMYLSPGIAAPPDRDSIFDVLNTVSGGRLPSNAEMRRIGVTSFLTNTQCAGVPHDQIRAQLGEPVAQIPLADAEEVFGFSGGLTSELYDLPTRS
jgi:hypothetical protein